METTAYGAAGPGGCLLQFADLAQGPSEEGAEEDFSGHCVSGKICCKWLHPKLKSGPGSVLAHGRGLFLDFTESFFFF